MSKVAKSAFCITVLLASVATAHNLIEPSWGAADRTTFQEWTFEDSDNPASPEAIRNEYGQAVASILVGDMGAGWIDTLPGFGSQKGFWDLGNGGTITLDIDNQPDASAYKEVWVQVTYYLDISQAPIVEVPGATYLGGQTLVVEDLGMGGWFLDQSSWSITPNPAHEQIILTANAAWGSIVDQIAVHTICVPEPTSFILLALGGLALLKRARSK